MALHMVRSTHHRQRRVHDSLRGDEQLGRKPRRYQLRPHRCRPHHIMFDITHPCLDAQRARREDLPSGSMERLRHG